MGNRKNLPQHATPTPSLRLIPAHFTEKNLRGPFPDYDNVFTD
jgi:hypothetical protein